MATVNIDGTAIYYVTRGDLSSTPLVLVHGAGGTHRHWLNQVQEHSLPEGVLALDLPGHGNSGGVALNSVAEYARVVLKVLDALQISRAILGGHSMGGAIALTAALEAPAKAAGLVLVATGARLRVAPQFLNTFAAGERVPNFTSYLYGPAADPELVAQAEAELEAVSPAASLADFSACDTFDVREHLAEISIPALILVGTEDVMTPPKYAEFMAATMPFASLTTIEEAGHMLMLEKPAAVNQAIISFIQNLKL